MNDLFDSGPQQLGFDMGEAQPVRSYEPDRDAIRAELREVLKAARAATREQPWDARTFRYHQVVFPQMAQWLPSEERDQLCFEFDQEVRRLEALMAA